MPQNKLYPLAREAFLNGEIDWMGDDIVVVLIDTDQYLYDDAHEFLDPDVIQTGVDEDAVVATSDPLTGKDSTDGVADAAPVTLDSVVGAESEALILVQDTGNPLTSRLIAYIDDAVGLPVTPNTGDIQIIWDVGVNKIFKL